MAADRDTVLRVIGRVLRGLLLTLAALVVFIEEVGWRPLSRWVARLTQWPPLARLEDRLRRASPRVAIVLFLLPAVLLFPIKLLALWAIEQGHAASGIAVILAAKLLGTALVGRLFVLTEPQLMQFAWFRRALGWWLGTKAAVLVRVHQSRAWRSGRWLMRSLRARWRRFTRRA